MSVINPPEKKLAKRTSVQCVELKLRWRFCVHVLKSTSNQSFLIFQTPDLDYNLLSSMFETLLNKLSYLFIYLKFKDNCFNCVSNMLFEQILVEVCCFKI